MVFTIHTTQAQKRGDLLVEQYLKTCETILCSVEISTGGVPSKKISVNQGMPAETCRAVRSTQEKISEYNGNFFRRKDGIKLRRVMKTSQLV